MNNKSKSLTTYVALLRGINVGGHTLVSMSKLKKCFEELGYQEVKTYINSGNVIFKTIDTDPRKLELIIEKALISTFSFPLTVIVRSFTEMKRLMIQIPGKWQTSTDRKCNIIFLRHTIDSSSILRNFNPKPKIEEVIYYPGVLLWSANTSDLTRSDMIKLATKPIYKEMTVRIFNTVRKIYSIMQEANYPL